MNAVQRMASPPALEAGLVVCCSSGYIGGMLASATGSIFLVLFWRFLLTILLLGVTAAPACAKWAFAKRVDRR